MRSSLTPELRSAVWPLKLNWLQAGDSKIGDSRTGMNGQPVTGYRWWEYNFAYISERRARIEKRVKFWRCNIRGDIFLRTFSEKTIFLWFSWNLQRTFDLVHASKPHVHSGMQNRNIWLQSFSVNTGSLSQLVWKIYFDLL